ncbi:MAG: hypothetical protein IKY10_04100, partial [Clostridia bacterium]|nr:hypothetical protein [Clostridia bacterium]
MKKFIAFVLILLVSVSVGVTVFYFMRDNEELVVNSESFIYLNKGDSLEIDAKLENAKIGNDLIFTSLNSSVLEWNPALNCFYAEEGGAAIIEIKAKNGKTSPVYIEVNIGNGMKEAPYYIDSEEDLLKIGSDEDDSIFEANDNYILMKDISLSSSIAPILNGKEFTGSFNGNGYTIKDLSLNSVDFSNAGLFATIGETGVVKELNLSNVNINGNYLNAGSIAGVNKGTITRCAIENGVVTSTNAEANVGGVCGVVLNSNSYCGRIDRCSSKISVVGTKNIGGLTGKNEGGILINSYCYLENSNKIEATAESANIGGIIGLNKNSNDVRAIVKNCYSVATIISSEGVNAANNKVGSLIGFNDEISMYSSNYIMGLYANTTDIPTANHEFNLTFNENQKAEKVNFRGLTENFPKNESNVIKTEELISFVSKKSDNSLTDNLWDFTNVWVIDVNVNNGYPSLNKFGANVPDEIEITYDQSIISNKEEFIQFMQAVNNGTAAPYYKLNADIPLNYSDLFNPIGTYKNPFNGTFDGNGHTISQVKISKNVIDSLSIKYVGLFGKISSSASIKNLTVEDIVIENGATYAGGIAGYNEGTIVNSQVKQSAKNKDAANISATYTSGGIAGANLGTIDNCKV